MEEIKRGGLGVKENGLQDVEDAGKSKDNTALASTTLLPLVPPPQELLSKLPSNFSLP